MAKTKKIGTTKSTPVWTTATTARSATEKLTPLKEKQIPVPLIKCSQKLRSRVREQWVGQTDYLSEVFSSSVTATYSGCQSLSDGLSVTNTTDTEEARKATPYST
ncbi:hypothetical protein SRHO_G00239210 [Serrasalmus rhombeus]